MKTWKWEDVLPNKGARKYKKAKPSAIEVKNKFGILMNEEEEINQELTCQIVKKLLIIPRKVWIPSTVLCPKVIILNYQMTLETLLSMPILILDLLGRRQ